MPDIRVAWDRLHCVEVVRGYLVVLVVGARAVLVSGHRNVVDPFRGSLSHVNCRPHRKPVEKIIWLPFLPRFLLCWLL